MNSSFSLSAWTSSSFCSASRPRILSTVSRMTPMRATTSSAIAACSTPTTQRSTTLCSASAITRATGTVTSAPARATSRQRLILVSGDSVRRDSTRMEGCSTAAVQKMYEAIQGQLIQAPPEYADASMVLATSPISCDTAPRTRNPNAGVRHAGETKNPANAPSRTMSITG